MKGSQSGMPPKRLSPRMWEFFVFRYGGIVLFVHLTMIVLYFLSEDKDVALPVIAMLVAWIAMTSISISEYVRLKKNMRLSKVVLEDDLLIIDDKAYKPEEVDRIVSISLQHALDKFYLYIVEIRTVDNGRYLFLDKPMNWKFESPTIRLMKKQPLFASKVVSESMSKNGFASLTDTDS